MRRTVVPLAISSILVFGAGCSSEPANDRPDQSEPDAEQMRDVDEQKDVAEDTSGPSDVASDVAVDTGPTDGSDGPADGDDMQDGGSPEDGSTTDTDDPTPDTVADTAPTEDTTTDSGPGDTDTSPPSTFGAGTFVREFYVDNTENERQSRPSNDPRCCFDIDGDGQQENRLADYLDENGSIAGFDVDGVNTTINDRIYDGTLVYLFEYKNWASGSNWNDDISIDMFVHPGQDADSSFDDNRAGIGQFEILPDSYDASGNPKSAFNSAETTPDGSNNADLTAEGGTIQLPIEFGQGFATTLNLHQPKLTADVSGTADVTSGGTVPLDNGELGGAIPKSDVITGLNEAASSCQCYDTTNNKLIEPQGGESYSCNVDDTCNCSNQTLIGLELACDTLRQDLNDKCDVNLDNTDPNKDDALSFGASFEGIDAEIVGVAP